MKSFIKLFLVQTVIAVLIITIAAVDLNAQSSLDPKNAFLRSLVMPGWGHHYVDSDAWGRGQAHLGAEVVLIASYFGLNRRAANLEDHFKTLSNLRAGVDISNRDRAFILAMGEFNSLEEYNEQQLRTRNWNRLIEDRPENRWQWESDEDRSTFTDLRSNRDRLRNQLPALLSLMAVNRVVSGISAYSRARNHSQIPEVSLLPIHGKEQGIMANIRFRF